VSVPMWGVTLSGPLPVVVLVGHYPANKLMGHRPLPKRIAPLVIETQTSMTTWGISNPFGLLSPALGQVTYVVLTRPPLKYPRRGLFVRLACVRHAASVHPEPGSNSPSVNKSLA
jgi:hypothetical protein